MESGSSILIDHYKNPRCKGVIAHTDRQREIHNRKCGDRLSFTARIHDRTLHEIRFEGDGCFYCIASASILCSTIPGGSIEAVLDDIARFRTWLMDEEPRSARPPESMKPKRAGSEADERSASARDRNLDTIRALGEVKAYPMRIDCVDLAWKGVEALLSEPEDQ